MPHLALPLAVLVALAAVLAGCGGGADTATEATDHSNVSRDVGTGRHHYDVVVNLTWNNGRVTPSATQVAVRKGDKVEVVVSSDSAQQINVSGHPRAAAKVTADQTQRVAFTIDSAKTAVRVGRSVVVSFVTRGSLPSG